jgi:hypothetical protein
MFNILNNFLQNPDVISFICRSQLILSILALSFTIFLVFFANKAKNYYNKYLFCAVIYYFSLFVATLACLRGDVIGVIIWVFVWYMWAESKRLSYEIWELNEYLAKLKVYNTQNNQNLNIKIGGE